jgi:hypothetical protein
MRRFPTAAILELLSSGRVSGHSTGKDPASKAVTAVPFPEKDIDYDKLAAETFGIVKIGSITAPIEAPSSECNGHTGAGSDETCLAGDCP